MGTWGVAIKDNDTFADIYDDFFELYNNGEDPENISKKLFEKNREVLEIEEDKNNFWFALALAQWETKSLDAKVLSTVENIVSSQHDLEMWERLDASPEDIKKRSVVLEKFLEKIKSEKPKAKPRKKEKPKTPIFNTGDCLTFKLNNGNYGGAIILAVDTNSKTGYNLVATTRINAPAKPTIKDFKRSEVLICNFGKWEDKPDIAWHLPDLYLKSYAALYEIVGNIPVEIQYDASNSEGKGYLFHPSYTAGWNMPQRVNDQFESEKLKLKPSKAISINQITKKSKWWKFW
jgi:hypothetical protein